MAEPIDSWEKAVAFALGLPDTELSTSYGKPAVKVASNGRAFSAPRFMPDGRHVLVSRDEPRADGTLRPDLWLWDRERRGLRRVLGGLGAQPDPDRTDYQALSLAHQRRRQP